MHTKELAKIDLNLLISFQVLLEEGNVSRAAERLFITQPAMSKTLSRLRALFDDPLFTRSSHGMQPTPRALEIGDGLGNILGDIRQLVSGSRFDPTTFTGEVSLAVSEYIGLTLLPLLAQRLQREAPQLSLRVVTRIENQLEELALGNLDFAVHIQQANYGDNYRVEPLGGSPLAILVRDGHPLSRGVIDSQRLTDFSLIRLYIPDWEQLEIQRSAVDFTGILNRQQGSLETSHLLTALEVLRHTDYFMPAPAYILQNQAATHGIRALPMPEGSNFHLDYVLVAHHRTARSPLHNWLWDQIMCTIHELRSSQQRKIRQRVQPQPAQQASTAHEQ